MFNRVVLRFGVRNVALILPIVYIIVFSWFFLEYGLIAALVSVAAIGALTAMGTSLSGMFNTVSSSLSAAG